MTWRMSAPCASTDPDLWFPEPKERGTLARQICASCPFQQRCLDEALQINPEYGIWAGRSPRELRGLRVELGIAPQPGTDLVCPDGHERAVHGFRGADGKLRCRACNRGWLRESRARKRGISLAGAA